MKYNVLVIGGTGHYGSLIVHRLIEKGIPVRLLTRNIENARKHFSEKLEYVKGDVTQSESVVKALDGVSSVVISLSAFNWNQIRNIEQIERDAVFTIIDKARQLGIPRIVLISVYQIKMEVLEKYKINTRIARLKLDVETKLMNSGLNWTILGAAPSMEIFFAMLRGEKMIVPGGGPPALPTISPLDLGEIAAQAAVRMDLAEKRFRMTAPTPYSFPQAADIISKVWKKNIAVKKIPLILPRIGSLITYPFNPYIYYLVANIKLMNHFPQDLVELVPQDSELLQNTFDYQPTTLEMEAERRMNH